MLSADRFFCHGWHQLIQLKDLGLESSEGWLSYLSRRCLLSLAVTAEVVGKNIHKELFHVALVFSQWNGWAPRARSYKATYKAHFLLLLAFKVSKMPFLSHFAHHTVTKSHSNSRQSHPASGWGKELLWKSNWKYNYDHIWKMQSAILIKTAKIFSCKEHILFSWLS